MNEQAQKAEAPAPLPTESASFSLALVWLKEGKRVTRAGWNGKGLWIELQVPDAGSKMTLPYLYLCYPADGVFTNGMRVPWAPSQTDVLASDWSSTS